MKVKELIEELKKFNPDDKVGGSGHFGECLDIWYIQKEDDFVAINTEPAGPDPEDSDWD